MKKIHKVIKVLINTLMTLILIIGIMFIFLYFIGIEPFVVESGSMKPTIPKYSLCFINKHTNYNKIQEKDIIAFKQKDGTLVTHRAVKVTESGIKTKGDRNKDIDSNIVKKENFVGKNIFWISKVGYVVKGFQSTKGKIIIITCIVLLFVSGFLFGEDKKKSKNNK